MAEDIYWVQSLSSANPRDAKMAESLFFWGSQSNEEPSHIHTLLIQCHKCNNSMHKVQRKCREGIDDFVVCGSY